MKLELLNPPLGSINPVSRKLNPKKKRKKVCGGIFFTVEK